MSKGNMLLGHARGKVGDLVFSRSNGQQVTRSRAAVVKNPQTASQMIQRIMLNTVAQAYSRLRPLCDHSFEGVQEGQASMSAFMKKNLKQLRTRVSQAVANNESFDGIWAFTPVGQNVFMPNAFVLSSGSLPGVDVITFPTSTAAVVALGGDTYGEILDANNLQRGDQLTFVIIKGTTTAAATLHYVRVILDPTNADGSQAPLSTPFLADGAVNLPSPRNQGAFDEVSIADGNLSFNVGALRQIAQCAAVIVSRKGSDGNWMRSNTSFTLNERGVAGLMISLQEALDIFDAGGFDTVNSLYLNNAGTGAVAGAAANNQDAFEFTTSDGRTVNGVAVRNVAVGGQNAAVIVDADGNEYFVYNDMSVNRYYQYYMSSIQPEWVASNNQEWKTATGATDANTVKLSDGEDEGVSVKAWLIRHGVGYFS